MTTMKKKVGKTGGNSRRQAVKDLAPKSKNVKGGDRANLSEFAITKTVDKASAKLF